MSETQKEFNQIEVKTKHHHCIKAMNHWYTKLTHHDCSFLNYWKDSGKLQKITRMTKKHFPRRCILVDSFNNKEPKKRSMCLWSTITQSLPPAPLFYFASFCLDFANFAANQFWRLYLQIPDDKTDYRCPSGALFPVLLLVNLFIQVH